MSDTPSPTPQEVTSAQSWKQSRGVGAALRVPSGNTCLVKPMNMQALMRNNLIPNELMKVITEAMETRSAPDMSKMTDGMNPDRMIQIMDTMDDVVRFMVVEPKLHPVPPLDSEGNDVNRDPSLLYIDEIDADDKTFIWQYAVGGTRNVEKFREGLDSYVGSLEQEQNVETSTE